MVELHVMANMSHKNPGNVSVMPTKAADIINPKGAEHPLSFDNGNLIVAYDNSKSAKPYEYYARNATVGHWLRSVDMSNSRGVAIEGRSLLGNANPNDLSEPATCGAGWALDLGNPIVGTNNTYTLACAAVGTGGAQANSDVVTTRRATVAPTALNASRLQIQTTRIQGALFDDGIMPVGFSALDSETHDLLVNSYYVAANSTLIPGVPALRRKTLVQLGGAPAITDQEVAPGVVNMQLQFGVDVDDDNTVDRYVNPGDAILTPGAAGFIPGSRVITARIWLVVRGITIETGIQDNVNYAPGDIALGTYNDSFRRMQVSKTILLRNARS